MESLPNLYGVEEGERGLGERGTLLKIRSTMRAQSFRRMGRGPISTKRGGGMGVDNGSMGNDLNEISSWARKKQLRRGGERVEAYSEEEKMRCLRGEEEVQVKLVGVFKGGGQRTKAKKRDDGRGAGVLRGWGEKGLGDSNRR